MNEADLRALAASLGVQATTASVLHARGITDPAKVAKFFDPKLADLTPPEAMMDRSAAAARLAHAVRTKERVCVFGDYDADGVTSTALLTDVLRTLGADVTPLLADRFEGGYGLSHEALQRVFATNATLLVTCDCGTSDHPRLHDAKKRGLDVIVIDHHKVPDEALPALAFLNPHRPGCGFPYKGLASVGLALSICAAVRAELGAKIDLRMWLDLVALGTIADVAPLDGDNRALVRVGLGVLARGMRQGTKALAEIAKISGATVTGEDVAFRFAPRLNAPGRLAKADLALELLLAKDPATARAIAAEVDQVCESRRVLDRTILKEAIEELEDPALASLPVIVLGRQGWHQGVVGIVAGRLASKFGKPTIVIGFDGASGRGSARGPAGVKLYTMLGACSDALHGFGGHEAAAGVHLDFANLDRLRNAFADAAVRQAEVDAGAAAAAGISGASPRDTSLSDASFFAGDEPARVHDELARFEPCGQGNPAPRLAFDQVRVRSARVVGEGHLKLELEIGKASLPGFGFRIGGLLAALPKAGDRVDVTGSLRPDAWRGNGAVELRIASFSSDGNPPVLSD